MGMYDLVWINCPECNTKIEFQSKAGECGLKEYNIYSLPARIALDILDEVQICPNCGIHVKIEGCVNVMLRAINKDEQDE